MLRLFKSKLFQLAVVLTLACSIVLTGSYAWNDFFNRTTTRPLSLATDAVTLYDFSGQLGEVYAVNNSSKDMVVRVRLVQYLASDGISQTPGALRDDTSTWSGQNAIIARYYRLIFSKAVMTMEEWLQQGAPMGDYWVADEGGWYYYAKKLSPGEATRTLLQEIAKNSFIELVNDEYKTETTLQAVSRRQVSDLIGIDSNSFTPNGALLMRYVSGEMVEFTGS